MRFFFCLIILAFGLQACQNKVETVEGFDDDGNLLERYTRKTEDYARHGTYIKYYENGEVEEHAHFQNDTLHGQRTLFYENGDTLIVENYTNGQFSGDYRTYFQSGVLESEGAYVDGVMEGKWTFFYENKKIKEIVQFKNNEENGPFVEYYKDGNMKAKGTYRTTSENIDGNKEHGLLELYNEGGDLERKMECNLGICRTIWTKKDSEKKI